MLALRLDESAQHALHELRSLKMDDDLDDIDDIDERLEADIKAAEALTGEDTGAAIAVLEKTVADIREALESMRRDQVNIRQKLREIGMDVRALAAAEFGTGVVPPRWLRIVTHEPPQQLQ